MDATKTHTVLRTSELSIGYRSKRDIATIGSHITLSLERGQLIGLVGANGIGKSTLIRTLIGVQPALSGSVMLHERSITDISSIELAKILSVVLTEQVASKNLTVKELIALGRQPYTNWVGNLTDADIAIIKNAIASVKLQDIQHKKCYELSDGQLQKVMIARALAQDTDIIVLDEPTTHLDMYHKAYILNLLKELVKQTNKTIIFSSHEIDLAIQLCDSMIVMNTKNVLHDSPCNLIERGVFETLFPEDLIAFNKTTGSFRIKK